ncbi:Gfo/Idh/MocA family oxidoreductase [Paenibacillus sp. J5C_2022]|uniref:Gfo/Idh/MocA family protein n=1 Tax=Paenibacillus sp. J5C2022 TaxID=2977129 RepID=UPI0021D39C1D|nr:Gfo/Idh/MocA family oxidoreductase [Paenibacillus sp. J5C2022]MCU6707847.1 Gfo/Idh/MocA family oxidoreductase [Paenibacillus sp. J5C2022]
MVNEELKLGMIGLDTSHVIKFTELLQDPAHPHHVPGARIMAGYPGGSSDLAASYSRVEGFTEQLRGQYGVAIMASPEEVAEASDALLITSVDGRVHKSQFEAIACYGKPVFIDKPFTCSLQEAEHIYKLAASYGIPIMSCSVLRYLEPLETALKEDADVMGADCYSPMALEATNPGWFWYGIHGVEMLFRILGRHCESVSATFNDRFEYAVGEWADGRIGTIRGNRTGNYQYGATLHYRDRSVAITSAESSKPMAAVMLERIIKMFRTGRADIAAEETLAIIRFIEAVNESRSQRRHVNMNSLP